MPSFSSVIPFDIFLSLFVCSFPEVLLCSTKVMSSCTLLRIQNSFLKFSGECSLESYRCCFPPLVDTLFPPPSFPPSLTRSVQCWCLSQAGLCPFILSDLYLEDRLTYPASGRLHLVLLKLNPFF